MARLCHCEERSDEAISASDSCGTFEMRYWARSIPRPASRPQIAGPSRSCWSSFFRGAGYSC